MSGRHIGQAFVQHGVFRVRKGVVGEIEGDLLFLLCREWSLKFLF